MKMPWISRRRGAQTVLLALVALLALAAFATAGPVAQLLARRTPLPSARQANPRGTMPAMTAAQRLQTRRGIGRARLIIPSVGVSASWIPVRITGSQLEVPADVRTTGLWAGGGAPGGTRGTVLLDGHVNYVGQGEGALFALSQVRPGALIALSSSAGRTVWWRTVRVTQMPKQQLPQDLFSAGGPRRLVIVTCGGVLESDGHYEDNVVLFARPVVTSRAHGRSARTSSHSGPSHPSARLSINAAVKGVV